MLNMETLIANVVFTQSIQRWGFVRRLIQLVISVLFQFFMMRDMEKLAGWLRIAIIYLGSGVAGSLSSAIFLPYHVEVSHSLLDTQHMESRQLSFG